MGQYFILVNLDKREYVRAWGMKLWEWCANNEARLLPWLLARGPQDGTTLCDFVPGIGKVPRDCVFRDGELFARTCEEAMKPIGKGYFKTAGRWAGDRVVLVGDYDDSNLFSEALESYRDITAEVVKEFNEFIEYDDLKVTGLSYARPDMMVSANGVSINPIVKPKRP